MKILVTGANGDIGEAIGRILQESFPDAAVFGADAAGRWPGGFTFEKMLELPHSSAFEYADHISRLAEGFDLIIPSSEPEILRLSKTPSGIGKLPLLMVDSRILNIFMDKYETAMFFERNGLKAPSTKRLSEVCTVDRPLYVKPRRGAGGRGHRLVTTNEELHFMKQVCNADWIAQEYLPGDDNEFTCALFRFGSELRTVILKRRLHGDKTVRAEVVENPEIEIILGKVALLTDLEGCINVQLKLTDDGPMVFEINPRLSSTVMMRHRLGFKDCEWWVKSFLGMDIGIATAPKAGAVAYRTSMERVVSE